MVQNDNGLHFTAPNGTHHQTWTGPFDSIAFEPEAIRARLLDLSRPCTVVRYQGKIGLTAKGDVVAGQAAQPQGPEFILSSPPLSPQRWGDPMFRAVHGVDYAYTSGAMANGIASESLVIAMGQAGFLSSFGAAGLLPSRVKAAIHRIQQALPSGPYAFNLIHSPSEEALEREAVELYLNHGVTTVEASAFLGLTPHIVRYRVTGLTQNAGNQIVIGNKVIAKISRREVAQKFMEPAPSKILNELVQQNLITPFQANLAEHIPLADDITVEADSGGHTDNRPLVSLLPAIIALKDEIQAQQQYSIPIRVGAAGGIGAPAAVLAAFMMGAAYVVTGSINQACVEAGASDHTKSLLAQADMADVMMAPAADMFEMGVKLQVLKRGTLFPMRAQKLYELYQSYDSIDDIPTVERNRLESRIFKQSLDSIWAGTVAYFMERDPEQIKRAEDNPKRKMALIFRWYLGLSSRWSNVGEAGRETDYQIWCGPAMGAFNQWVKGSYLAEPKNRRATDIAHHLMIGASFIYRAQQLRLAGLHLPAYYSQYCPEPQPLPARLT